MNRPLIPANGTTPPGPYVLSLLDELKAMQKNPLKLITGSFDRYRDFICFPLGSMNVYFPSAWLTVCK